MLVYYATCHYYFVPKKVQKEREICRRVGQDMNQVEIVHCVHELQIHQKSQ